MIGKIFGRLTVLEDSGKRNHRGQIIWTCICRCGNKTNVRGDHLISGSTKSCGCLKKGGPSHHLYVHGGFGTLLYGIWRGMRDRCYRKKNPKYKYYGAKGIKVCPSWLNDFLAFRIWALSHGYKSNLTIDRINHKGNYEPSNCQWLTASENSKKAMRDKKIIKREYEI